MHEKLWFGKHAHDMLVFVKVRPMVRTGDPGQTGRHIREGWADGPGFRRGEVSSSGRSVRTILVGSCPDNCVLPVLEFGGMHVGQA